MVGGTSIELPELKWVATQKPPPTLALPRQREREQVAVIYKISGTQRQP